MKQINALFFTLVILLFSCTGGKKTDTGWSDTIPVEVMVAEDGSTASERNYVGTVGSEHEATLSFSFGGTLTRVLVHNGQRVSRGQVLAEVDATTATSIHATAAATLRQAEDAYRRLEAVHREGGISEVRWMEMQTDLEKARQAETSARKQKEDCTLRAPFDGVVACADRHAGQEMRPGEVFGTVIDMGRMRVSFSVPEQEISLVKVGDRATATVQALGDRQLQLRVSDKGLMANPLGHTYNVNATIVEGDRTGLLPDMVAKVRATLDATDGMVIPSDCVHTMPGGTVVWVVKGGRAEHRNITVGGFVRDGVAVNGGLAAGDTVVVVGHQKLYTGAKVKIQ